jgi:hypothetical protein
MGIERFAVLFGGCGSYQSGARSTAADMLNRVEYSGMLAGMGAVEQFYFYAFFGDEACRLNLAHWMYKQVVAIAKREEWRGDGDLLAGIIRLMVQTALDENLDGRCHACSGTGITKRVKVCAACGGSGVARLTDFRVASIIGIDRSNYSRRWKQRYDRVFVMIQDIECSVKMTIRRAEHKEAVLLA